MKIGLDGIVLREHAAGSHRYFEQLLTGLGEHAADNEFVVFADARRLRADALPRQHNFFYRNVDVKRWLPAALQQQLFLGWNARGALDVLHAAVSVRLCGIGVLVSQLSLT